MNYSNERTKPKLFLRRPTVKFNQKIYYSNKVMENIHSQFGKLEHIIGTHDLVHENLTKQLDEQEKKTKQVHESITIQFNEQIVMNEQFQKMHTRLKDSMEEKGDVQSRLLLTMEEYEVERVKLEEKLDEIAETKANLLDHLHTLEKTESDLRAEVTDQSSRISEQEARYDTMQKEQADQVQKQDEMFQQLNLQKLDHEELTKIVKNSQQDQKQMQAKIQELFEQMNFLSTQQYEQENMHLDLYTQLIQLKTIQTEMSNFMKQSIDKLNLEIEKLEIKEGPKLREASTSDS
ncbi:hypothetical protein [Halalkalibacter okhensis]|uniref:Uncharacterized protein n=1 Tax=Halalkalibacter okhensis TaxID=333138 RepID=A0A0B0IKH3_9BACI|nr:hypothetical protein [Halalkalibacter okhensis]KHF40176.1 hypothetical protein LQ50_10525 [Halalkalibacter okhensis]